MTTAAGRDKKEGGREEGQGNPLLWDSLPIFAFNLLLLAALAGLQLVALSLQLPAHIASLRDTAVSKDGTLGSQSGHRPVTPVVPCASPTPRRPEWDMGARRHGRNTAGGSRRAEGAAAGFGVDSSV